MLRPISDYFFFTFLNEISNGFFVQKNSGKIQIANASMNPHDQGHPARWGKITAVGPAVKDFTIGEIVLLEPGKWTTSIEHDGEKVWKSQEQYIIATGDDESVAYDY